MIDAVVGDFLQIVIARLEQLWCISRSVVRFASRRGPHLAKALLK